MCSPEPLLPAPTVHSTVSLGHWPHTYGTLSHTHTHTHLGTHCVCHLAGECERDKNQHSATPAALPAELMHSQRSSRLNESVVGFALLSLAYTAAAPIHTAGVKIVDTRILTKESMSIYYSIRKYSTYVNSI